MLQPFVGPTPYDGNENETMNGLQENDAIVKHLMKPPHPIVSQKSVPIESSTMETESVVPAQNIVILTPIMNPGGQTDISAVQNAGTYTIGFENGSVQAPEPQPPNVPLSVAVRFIAGGRHRV